MLAVFHVFQSFGSYGFGTLAALVLVSRGYDVTSSLLYTALSYLGYPVGSVLAIALLRWFERKYLVMGAIAALAGFGLLFATVENTVLIVAFGFLTTATSNVFSNVYHVYQAEIFPTDVRAPRSAGRIRCHGCRAPFCRSSSSRCSTTTAPPPCSRSCSPHSRSPSRRWRGSGRRPRAEISRRSTPPDSHQPLLA